jgi:hypothetical protein
VGAIIVAVGAVAGVELGAGAETNADRKARQAIKTGRITEISFFGTEHD